MSRITITLAESRYRALKEAAAKRGKSIRQIIDESLELYGIKTREEARELVRQARAHSGMMQEEAQKLANKEVQDARRS